MTDWKDEHQMLLEKSVKCSVYYGILYKFKSFAQNTLTQKH